MFDLNTTFICIGIVVITFIICVSLLIFAPKSINYYYKETYPILTYINDNNINVINNDFEKIENDKRWIEWPDKQFTVGNVSVFPIFMFSVISNERKELCSNMFDLLKNVPDIKSCAFIKLDKRSKIQKSTQWKELSNYTLRCIIVLKSIPSASIEQCGIWVNGESKKLSSKNMIIYDSSKEHSIYNETDYPIFYLMLDIKRPDKIPNGVSTREYTDEIYDFISLMSKQ